ncbi:MAG: hypothetical protein ABIK73_08965 [candidate division WOR-3 bacterium]
MADEPKYIKEEFVEIPKEIVRVLAGVAIGLAAGKLLAGEKFSTSTAVLSGLTGGLAGTYYHDLILPALRKLIEDKEEK